MVGESGYLIAITGPPSSGKSAVSRELEGRTSTFGYFDGDQFIRDHPPASLAAASQTFELMLDALAERMTSTNLILDVTLPAAYVKRTKERFGASAMIVSLRVEEGEWRRREAQRTDRSPLKWWGPAMTALQGPQDLYDLVIDTTDQGAEICADEILSEAQKFWEDVRT